MNSTSLLYPTIDWAITSIVHNIALYIRGVLLCIDGVSYAITHQSTTSKSIKWLCYTVIICIVLYIITLIVIYIPSQLFLYILHRYVNTRIHDIITYYITPVRLFGLIFYALPVAVIFLLNNFYQHEYIFLNVVNEIDSSLYHTIIKHKRASFTVTALQSLTRNCKLLIIAATITVLRYVPVLGSMIPTVWSMRFAYSMYRLHIQQLRLASNNTAHHGDSQTRTKFVLLILILYIIIVNMSQHAANVALIFLSVELSCRALLLELYECILIRVPEASPTKPSNQNSTLRYELNDSKRLNTDITHISAREFLIVNHYELLGIVSPIVLLCCIPLLGTFTLCIAHATAAFAMCKIIQRSNYTLK